MLADFSQVPKIKPKMKKNKVSADPVNIGINSQNFRTKLLTLMNQFLLVPDWVSSGLDPLAQTPQLVKLWTHQDSTLLKLKLYWAKSENFSWSKYWQPESTELTSDRDCQPPTVGGDEQVRETTAIAVSLGRPRDTKPQPHLHRDKSLDLEV